ncbi:MAG: hypothetical protein IKO12_01955 [Bacteroidaceae bacterium]|nr:hypothetical protein [Bacteroidaceae bacterium]
MKKLFTLLCTLLIAAGAWATTTVTSYNTTQVTSAAQITSGKQYAFRVNGGSYITESGSTYVAPNAQNAITEAAIFTLTTSDNGATWAVQNTTTNNYWGTLSGAAANGTFVPSATAGSWTFTFNGSNVNAGSGGYYINRSSGVMHGWSAAINLQMYEVTQVQIQKVTDLAELSNNKLYVITNARRTWNVPDNATSMSTIEGVSQSAKSQQFAIIQNGGNYYLYSVNAGKYLRDNNTFGDPQAVTILPTGNASYPFFFKFSDTKNINVGGSNQITIDTWSSIDAGNSNAIIEVGEFEAEEVGDDYIVNADFSSATGWTAVHSGSYWDAGMGLIGTLQIRGEHPVAPVDDTHKATQYCAGVECRWNTNYSSYQQTTSELPAGIYILSYDVANVNASTTKAAYENRFSVTVGSETITDGFTEWMNGQSGWTTHNILFRVDNPATATISLGYGTGSNNYGVGNTPVLYISNLKLTRYDLTQQETADAALAACYGVDKATATNPVETAFVVNGTFDSNIAGWTATGAFQNNKTANNQQGDFTGNFWENWNPTTNPKVNKMSQVISDIPNGTYKLGIAAFVNTLADPNNSQYVFANNDKVMLTSVDPTAYEVWTVVTDNKMEVGLEQTEAIANWMGIDNVSLTYYGPGDVTGEANIVQKYANTQNALKQAVQEAQEVVAAKQGVGAEIMQIPTETYNTYKQAVAAAKAVADNQDATLEELQQALAALNQATDAYANAEVNLPNPTAKYTIQLKDGGNYMALNEGTVLAANPVPFTIKETEGGYAITNGTEYVALKGGNAWAMNMSAEPYAWKINLLPDGYYTIAKASNANHVIGVDNTEAGSKCWANKSIATIGDKARWIIKTVVVEPDHGDSEDLVFNSAGTQLFELNNDEAITPNTGVQIDVTGTQIEKGIVVDYSGASVTNKETHECGFRATAIIQDSKGNVFEVKSRGDKETNIINVAEGLFGPNEEYTVTIKPIVYYDYDNFCDEIYDLWEAGKAAHQVPDPADESWGWDTSKTPAETTKTGSSTILDPAWTLAAVAQQWSQDLKDNNAGSTYFGTEVVPFTDCDPLPLYVDSREYVFLIKTDGSVQSNVKALAAQDFKAWDAWGNDITAEFLSVGGGTATGIDKVQNAAKGAIYNLAGQRVAKTTKGIYVSGGRKVAVK